MAEAAHHVQLPPATVRSWLLGRRYLTEAGERFFRPLVAVADARGRRLSFRDLTELHILGALRREHQIRMPAVRRAIDYLRKLFGDDHPLSAEQMLTDGKDLFIERYGHIVSVSQQGQMALKAVLDLYLKRIERDKAGAPVRLYPFTRSQIEDAPRSVVIDPHVQFGQPCLRGTGIPTAVIVERYKAGDSIQTLTKDYRRTAHEIEEAIRYEAAA